MCAFAPLMLPMWPIVAPSLREDPKFGIDPYTITRPSPASSVGGWSTKGRGNQVYQWHNARRQYDLKPSKCLDLPPMYVQRPSLQITLNRYVGLKSLVGRKRLVEVGIRTAEVVRRIYEIAVGLPLLMKELLPESYQISRTMFVICAPLPYTEETNFLSNCSWSSNFGVAKLRSGRHRMKIRSGNHLPDAK
ncbi:uncharacterized protein BDR25DRAFT_361788 [Lindgomyces ingoldianus]|uniref:Uncharacterized protein n=1 Tax=Lindgomyces ingoldianus TaxID=673940 RepID=A0ACB6QDR7_9PLEO|nr:uncharacterized protein BDR25DRAFT_361788 [Lindgomyces ingoldianus]KAF2464286.1 hypothetical protein BDR25DRAFT_361788 [Lindgomyces ingoldianus]